MRAEGFEKIDTKTLSRRSAAAGPTSHFQSAPDGLAVGTTSHRYTAAIAPVSYGKRIGSSLAEVRAFLSISLGEERLHGHGFLFMPVAIGFGSAVWFLSPVEPSAWVPFLALAVLAPLALITRDGRARVFFTFACLGFCGMALAEIETWRQSTVILDSSVTTDVMGVVERSEAAGPGRLRYIVAVRQTANPLLRRPPVRVSLLARARHEPFEKGLPFPDAQGCHRLPGRPCPVCTTLLSRHISMASVRWGISIALRSGMEGRMWRQAGRSSPYAGSSICAGRSAIVFARLRRVMPVPSPPPLSPMRGGQFPKIRSRRYGSQVSLILLLFPD